MSTVTLTIGPKSYPVACADGEEGHIAALGAMIAEKYAKLGSARAPLEAQNLVFAALFLADELAEARKEAADTSALDALRAELAELEQERAVATSQQAQDAAALDGLRREMARLEAELAAMASAPPPPPVPEPAPEPPSATPQIDLFASADPDPLLAERLEALAVQAEASAAALEALAPTP